MQRIRRENLQTLLDAGMANLIEALPEPQYETEHLPGAVNLSGELTAEVAALLAPDTTATVITYCSGPSCSRSKVAAAAFIRLGYADVRVYEGGKADWADAEMPFDGIPATAA